jgi:hypothetical protein
MRNNKTNRSFYESQFNLILILLNQLVNDDEWFHEWESERIEKEVIETYLCPIAEFSWRDWGKTQK